MQKTGNAKNKTIKKAKKRTRTGNKKEATDLKKIANKAVSN